MRAAIIPADITEPIRIDNIDPTLETFQSLVGGYIECVGIRSRKLNMYLNEEGKIEHLPVNDRATLVARRADAIHYVDSICGNVVIVGPFDDEGEETGLTDGDSGWLMALNPIQDAREEAGQQ